MQHTALYKAVKHGDAINVRRLLSVGSDPNETWGGLDTPLSVAAARGNTPILRLLLDAGAKPTWYALQVPRSATMPRPCDFCWLPALP